MIFEGFKLVIFNKNNTSYKCAKTYLQTSEMGSTNRDL